MSQMPDHQPRQRVRAKRRLWALVGLVVAVVVLHAWITQSVMAHLHELGGEGDTQIKRMEVELVAEMALTEPPVAVAPPPPPPEAVAEPSKAAPTPASAASKPRKKDTPAQQAKAASGATSAALVASSPASAPEPEPTAVAQAPTSDTSLDPEERKPQMPAPAASAASGPAFEWPKATRVTYKVEGYVRGPIYGNALVEWVRQDMRYQVHVDAILGPSFAPIGSRRWTSEGVISDRGLVPQRFESVDKLLIKSAKPKIVIFEDNDVVMPDGQRLAKLPGVQDAASHYIQLAYQFILNPGLIKVGGTIELPVAHTRRQEAVTYDIEAQETLDTPLGKVETFKLKPRKLQGQKPDELAEIWVAPGLQYLPIRMLVRQGDKNYLDMQMDKAPQQTSAQAASAAEAAGAGAPRSTEITPTPP